MIERYLILSARIKQELISLEKVVERAKRARDAMANNPKNEDLFLDSIALNIHDFYTGLERVLSQIVTNIDNSLPSGKDWHRELLNQMGIAISKLRPAVLSKETIEDLDEYRRFRHVVRNVYGFEFDLKRIEPLMDRLNICYTRVKNELLILADLLEQIADEQE